MKLVNDIYDAVLKLEPHAVRKYGADALGDAIIAVHKQSNGDVLELAKKVIAKLASKVTEAKKKAKKKKPKPTSPQKWAAAKAKARSKFDVYPSAYANAWAAKEYKRMGGGWRMGENINESVDPVILNRAMKEIKSIRFIAPAVEDIMVNVKEQARLAGIDDEKLDELENNVHKALIQLESAVIALGDPFKEIDEGQIYSTGGGAGQAYRKFVPKESSVMKGLMNYESK